ncbi:MAG: dephospho-CoA kinase [Proteobacteria bacterium]|nr:dephospho-CoA kinase [Pseudomonadota bacterium]
MSMALRIALTGGIGSGKSTVASKFMGLGVPVIDTDIISRNIVKPGEPCLKIIINEFGNQLLTIEGILDRHKLRNIIFNDKKARIKLEKILYPVIYQKINEQISTIDYQYCLIVIPLLVETQAMDHFDRILLVDIPEHLQVKRAAERDNISPQNVQNIIRTQANRTQRLKYANDIIDNSVKIEELNETVNILHNKYLELSGKNIK